VSSYEWHEAKNAENLASHGIDFADAVLIFDGPVLETVDQRKDYGEERIGAIGMTDELELCRLYAARSESPPDFGTLS
jgi:uncharacterized protein